MPAGFIKQRQIPDLKALLVSSCSPWMNSFIQDTSDFLDFPHSEQKNRSGDKPHYFFLFLPPPESKDNLSSSHYGGYKTRDRAELFRPQPAAGNSSSTPQPGLWGGRDALLTFRKENMNERSSYHLIWYSHEHFPSLASCSCQLAIFFQYFFFLAGFSP